MMESFCSSGAMGDQSVIHMPGTSDSRTARRRRSAAGRDQRRFANSSLVSSSERTASCSALSFDSSDLSLSVRDETASASDRISLLMLSDMQEGLPLHRVLATVETANRQGERLVSARNIFDVGIKVSYRIAPYNPLKKNAKFSIFFSLFRKRCFRRNGDIFIYLSALTFFEPPE